MRAAEFSSRADAYAVGGTKTTTRHVCIVRTSTAWSPLSGPIAIRPASCARPPEVPYMFALESAMDELAHLL